MRIKKIVLSKNGWYDCWNKKWALLRSEEFISELFITYKTLANFTPLGRKQK
jgi:hypothetical protein